MRVIAIRHAKSDYPLGVVDHDRPLSERGTGDATVAGRWLVKQPYLEGHSPLIIVSSATRAQQTWELISAGLDGQWAVNARDYVVEEPRAYDAPAHRLAMLAGEAAGSDVVIVAHNPGLQDLVLGARASELRNRAAMKHRTCAIAVLEATDLVAWQRGEYEVIDYVVPRA